ncbi:hypothetical protein CPB84DRAFT_1792317 [Gymnopilus junonius]|uniref:Uncharacterized protein n=1 Tax=Gymnopilus junonius TaxID=109634 RepID=A0A9P5TIM9_GYMJU|nr:hypothetical protein CPB84DRAFT_1792317 [Gymnopilus junonius]
MGADGFMLWRCIVLYQGIGPIKYLILTVVLGVLGLTSLAIGIAFFVVAGIYQTQQGKSVLPFVPDSLALPFQNSKQSAISSFVMFCTTFVNLTLTSLIFFRLLYYQRFISKTLGTAHASPYTRVITMCVESCALIVVISTTNIVMIISNHVGYLIPFMLLPHICVLSPLLIVYRVAIGRSANTKRPSSNRTAGQENDNGTEHYTSIRFNHPTSTAGTHNADDSLSSDSTHTNPAIPLSNMGTKTEWKDSTIGI